MIYLSQSFVRSVLLMALAIVHAMRSSGANMAAIEAFVAPLPQRAERALHSGVQRIVKRGGSSSSSHPFVVFQKRSAGTTGTAADVARASCSCISPLSFAGRTSRTGVSRNKKSLSDRRRRQRLDASNTMMMMMMSDDEASHSLSQRPSPSLTHADITWKIRPEESASLLRKLQWKVAGRLLRWQCRLQSLQPPRLLFPVSGQAVLLAYCGKQKIGRFGIVTQAGPVAPQLVETVQTVYGLPDCVFVRAAAIIYMFVEPEYRGRSVGALALEAIGYLHAARGCDYTVLVAANDKKNNNSDDDDDDDDKQTLVKWYERHGYSRAPALQEVLGSPNGMYGITMIAPTRQYVPDDCVVQWW